MPTAPSSTVWRWPPKARRSSTSAASRLGPVPSGSTRGSRRLAWCRSSKSLPHRVLPSASTPCTRTWRGRRCRAARRSSTTCPVDEPIPRWLPLLAEAGVPWVLMHWRSVSADRPHQAPHYRDVVAEVRAELLASVDDAVAAGVDPAKLVIDPGLGFAKTGQHNWALLHALPELVATGIPVLLGASRKRFLGTLVSRARWVGATAGRARDGDRGDFRAGRPARGLGCAGARRAGLGRRPQGRRGLDAAGERLERWLIESSCAA